MNHQLKLKCERLMMRLRSFDRVGIACSGGVDSTFLAHACCRALGMENVVVLFGDSPLLSSDLRTSIEQFLKKEIGHDLKFKKISVDPFSQSAFVKNPDDRCYICKKHIYQHFLAYLKTENVDVLLDGTNCDDLKEDRPGLKALEELGIVTPLVEEGFHKADIRSAAAEFHLGNADLPSNSCLATRIERRTTISDERLREIEKLESFLLSHGYRGCRVRPRQGTVIVEVLQDDLIRISKPRERALIVSYFQQNGYDVVLLNLMGRKG